MSSYFYLQAERNPITESFINEIENFSNSRKELVYLINKPLGDLKYDYSYKASIILLIPKRKIVFINFDENRYEEFIDYIDDVIEDLSSISDKFMYKNVIGRIRKWKNEIFVSKNISEIVNQQDFLNEILLNDDKLIKKTELLVSLLIGSINDINRIKEDVPVTLLDKVKQKIILFDADQTRFIYNRSPQKKITIQGLSGTGKTELLLHKLKDLYLSNNESRIFLTCYNKVLAKSLKSRIPDFFNFMKVEQQILWNERLWCENAWGKFRDSNSGLYTYLAHFYKVNFMRYSFMTSFKTVCKNMITEIKILKETTDFEYAFDYIIIDESQDFDESFFQLCELVTSEKIFVGGDIFQSIFDDKIQKSISPDYLLGKCYRTDPKTLMFAHGLGMGLFEPDKLRWLEVNEWEQCGYQVTRESNNLILSREPSRRFEDIEDIDSFQISTTDNLSDEIKNIIAKLKDDHPTILPEDIAIIFLDEQEYVYDYVEKISHLIQEVFKYETNIGIQTKEFVKNKVFITNKNNVKGLEFPFVICVTKQITNDLIYRNSLYTMLTRSFIKTFLVLPKTEINNRGLTNEMIAALMKINADKKMTITEPTDEEKIKISTNFDIAKNKPSEVELIKKVLIHTRVDKKKHKLIIETIMNSNMQTEINEEFVINYLNLYGLI